MTYHRYIWAYRELLCRSVHDMSKQKYASKKYAPVAWLPLSKWIFSADDTEVKDRHEKLLTFNKDDKVFHTLVAKCLWRLARGANLPWGRSAVQANVYSAIPVS